MKKKVLVFPCGSEIGLEIYRALKYSKDFELYGASSLPDHGKFVYENYIEEMPFVDADNFIEGVNKIIKKFDIDIIVPAHDSVVLKLSENRNKINAIIVTSDLKTCEICRSKLKTYQFFLNVLNIPKIYKKVEIQSENFPIFLKPDVGQGSKGTKKLNDFNDLNYYYKSEDLLLLEYLPGKEYTIDCFTNYKGELIFCSGRERTRISNGISVNSKKVDDKRFIEIAKIINSKLSFNGAWFYQLKEDINNDLSLLEIAPRIAGTMDFQRGRGINLPLLSLYNALNIDVDIIENKYEIELDRALENKFKLNISFENIYLDLDDTLIVDDKVNHALLSFLYKSISDNKKIYLLTKHKVNVIDTLNKYKIYNIFTEIIQIKKEEDKSDYIILENSIFIDDSHKERKNVFLKNNIPVFDVNMIDVLM